MNNKQRVFVEEYLKCWNATKAAEIVGYTHPNKQGPRLLVNVGIAAEIQRRINEKVMSANEVLVRLADIARGDIGLFMDIESMSFDISLQKAQELGITHLIKNIKQRTITTSSKNGEDTETNIQEIELYSALDALDKLARCHGLFMERRDITSGGEKINVSLIGDND